MNKSDAPDTRLRFYTVCIPVVTFINTCQSYGLIIVRSRVLTMANMNVFADVSEVLTASIIRAMRTYETSDHFLPEYTALQLRLCLSCFSWEHSWCQGTEDTCSPVHIAVWILLVFVTLAWRHWTLVVGRQGSDGLSICQNVQNFRRGGGTPFPSSHLSYLVLSSFMYRCVNHRRLGAQLTGWRWYTNALNCVDSRFTQHLGGVIFFESSVFCELLMNRMLVMRVASSVVVQLSVAREQWRRIAVVVEGFLQPSY